MTLLNALIQTRSAGDEPQSPPPNAFNDAATRKHSLTSFSSFRADNSAVLVGHFPREMRIQSIQSLVVYTNQARAAIVGLDVTYRINNQDVSVTHGLQTPQSHPVPLMSNGAHDRR